MEQAVDVVEKAVAIEDKNLAVSLLLTLGQENNQVASPQLEVNSSIKS